MQLPGVALLLTLEEAQGDPNIVARRHRRRCNEQHTMYRLKSKKYKVLSKEYVCMCVCVCVYVCECTCVGTAHCSVLTPTSSGIGSRLDRLWGC
jgi:hypothetical protein